MIPTTLLWWIVSVSDRYIITYMRIADANGLYAAAYNSNHSRVGIHHFHGCMAGKCCI